MHTSIKLLSVITSLCSLSACSTFNSEGAPPPYSKGSEMQLYPEGYENPTNYSNYSTPRTVTVPDSYHVSAAHRPATSKSVDQQWVSTQSATGYTIEVADSDKPASVANVLMKVPKTERQAEIKVRQGEKVLYKGLYGTYPSKEAAEQALQALPADVKGAAKVTSWGSVQGMAGE